MSTLNFTVVLALRHVACCGGGWMKTRRTCRGTRFVSAGFERGTEVAVVMAVLAVTATMACSHGFAGDATAGERAAATKLVLAHYMPWYETPEVRGAWGGHWRGFEPPLHDPSQNGPDGLPDIYSHYHPLIGPYDSTDPALVECHLAQMKLAGIDGVVVDWYGVAEAFDFPVSHGGSVAVCDAIGRYGMRFAACYEDRIMKMLADQGLLGSGGAEERLREDIGWLSKHWFSRPEYLRVGGRPLLMNFGPIQVTEPAPWAAAFADLPQQPAFFALHHLWRKVGADGGFTWIHWEPWKGEADDDAVRAELERTFKLPSSDPKQVIASAVAGYDDVYKRPNPRLDHRDGKTLRQSLARRGVGVACRDRSARDVERLRRGHDDRADPRVRLHVPRGRAGGDPAAQGRQTPVHGGRSPAPGEALPGPEGRPPAAG
ncbi:MAG: hypothetical protein EBR28_10235 [Planctomycetia bacterium]|nr:hypothetical protein [Planctomycetia bacterium]